MEEDQKKHQNEIVTRERYEYEMKDTVKRSSNSMGNIHMAIQIKRLKEQKSQDIDMLKIKKDTIIEKQKTLEDLRKNYDLIESEIAKLEHEKSLEFNQMKKKQDITTEMEKKMEDMEDVMLPTGFTLSATGWPMIKSPYLGDYTLTSEQRNGHPVYRHTHNWPMYCQEDGTWAIDGWSAVGNTQVRLRQEYMYIMTNDQASFLPFEIQVVYRSKDAAVIPALCQHWECKSYGEAEYNSGDIVVKFF